jgi:hypothetical protein
MAELEVGANLPWLDYGQDFGASAWRPEGGIAVPERRERLRAELGRIADSGATLLRLWLLGDGRAGLLEDDALHPLGLDDHVFPDFDCAIEALAEAGLRAHVVLTDFLWFAPVQVENGVRLGGRREQVRDPAQRADLLARVFVPIATRYGQAEEIAGWDLLNEPEWATLGVGTTDPSRAISKAEMREYLGELALLFHARARQPLSVGLASVQWLSLVAGLPLDLVQVHWYETHDSLATLARPVAPSAPGQPAPLLGEFPTKGASVPAERLLEIARDAGYSAALAWSSLATDAATDQQACLNGLSRFTSGRDFAERARA